MIKYKDKNYRHFNLSRIKESNIGRDLNHNEKRFQDMMSSKVKHETISKIP